MNDRPLCRGVASQRWFAALLVVPFCISSASADPLTDLERAQQKVFDGAAPSVVFLSHDGQFGSGFGVGGNLVLTNAHVVKGAKEVKAILLDGSERVGTVVEVARDDVDLALVELPGDPLPALPLSTTSELRVGNWAAAIGHGLGGAWTYTVGMVTNIYPTSQGRSVFQTQIPTNPGNSGGPVLDRRGQVIGVTTAIIANASNVAFAIRIDRALSVLTRLAAVCAACATVKAPDGVPVIVDGRMLGKGPQVSWIAERRTYEVMVVVGGQMRKKSLQFPATKVLDLSGP